MNQLNDHQLRIHVPIVGWLFIVQSSLLVIVAAFVWGLLRLIAAAPDTESPQVLNLIATIIGLFLIVLAAPGLAAGVGLLLRQNWARYLGVCIAAIGLINVPIGTIFGIYACWVLLQDAARPYFDNATR
jgi:hypothetical protein